MVGLLSTRVSPLSSLQLAECDTLIYSMLCNFIVSHSGDHMHGLS